MKLNKTILFVLVLVCVTIILLIAINIVTQKSFEKVYSPGQGAACKEPLIPSGAGCCFDNNNNSICDFNESTSVSSGGTATETSTSTTATTTTEEGTTLINYECASQLFKDLCKKYKLVFADYSIDYEYVICTANGEYTYDEGITDATKYLKIYAPTRTVLIKCNQYQEPSDQKENCKEKLFENLCKQKDMVYTEYSSTVGYISCTDDGFYTFSDITNGTNYDHIYPTQADIDAKCS